MPDVDAMFYDTVISSKTEMMEFIHKHLQQLNMVNRQCKTVYGLWTRIIHSKTDPCTYSVQHPVCALACVPGVKSEVPLGCCCVVLSEQDMLAVGTPDASKAVWCSCRMTLTVENPDWYLSEDVTCIEDPPAPCRVAVRLTGMKFKVDEDLKYLKFYYGNNIHLTVHNSQVNTREDVEKLVHYVKGVAEYSHCIDRVAAGDRIWFDLVRADGSKNYMAMRLPFLVRIVPRSYDRSRIPLHSVLVIDWDHFDKFGFPADSDVNTCIGLYKCFISMILSTDNLFVKSSHKDFWPGIQHDPQNLLPPKCHVLVDLCQVTFVSIVSEQEVISKWHCTANQKQDSTSSTITARVGRWWAGVHASMQRLLNAPDGGI